MPLTPAQRAALAYVRRLGRDARPAALARLAGHPVPELLAGVRRHGRITLNFHPDRPATTGRTVVDGLLAEGRYRSQYETGISNGSRSAHPGGLRDNLERVLFADAYHGAGVAPADHPTYGGLDLAGHPDGASPRFGSCHLVLRPEVLDRATFSHGDSYLEPVDRGTIDAFEPVLAGLLGAAPDHATTLLAPTRDPPNGHGRVLDEYIEVQVHGPVRLATDVAALVADPSFRDTPTGTALIAVADRYGLPLSWHAGFTLAVDAVPAEFRGPRVPPFAAHLRGLYGGDRLDAAVLGRAAIAITAEPERWRDWGTFDEVLQLVKQLWHVLVRYGEPA
jgi:hypothetical protein